MRRVMNVRCLQSGFSLMDVLAAIIVFAVGVLGFVQLQAGLSRSGLDARLRTMASNIAEEQIETQRRFTRLGSDPAGVEFAYNDIVTETRALTQAGVRFTINQAVTDYYWNKGTRQFTTTPAGSLFSDFKRVEISVSWENPLEYQIDESRSTTGNLGSGAISMTVLVSSEVSATERLVLLKELDLENFEPAATVVGSLLNL